MLWLKQLESCNPIVAVEAKAAGVIDGIAGAVRVSEAIAAVVLV